MAVENALDQDTSVMDLITVGMDLMKLTAVSVSLHMQYVDTHIHMYIAMYIIYIWILATYVDHSITLWLSYAHVWLGLSCCSLISHR